jgi:hypothetical protein
MCNDNPTQPITSYGKSYIICQYLYLKAILQSFHYHFNSYIITILLTVHNSTLTLSTSTSNYHTDISSTIRTAPYMLSSNHHIIQYCLSQHRINTVIISCKLNTLNLEIIHIQPIVWSNVPEEPVI